MTTPDMKPGETTPASAPPLIPRAVLFGDPDRLAPALSADGTTVAFIAPDEGVQNVFVQPADGSAPARPVTKDRDGGVKAFHLCPGDRLVYVQDGHGDENWRLRLLDLATGRDRLVTPPEGVRAYVAPMSPQRPDAMVVLLDIDVRGLHDPYRLDLVTGELTKLAANPGREGQAPFAGWLIDWDLHVRGGWAMTGDGGMALLIREGGEGEFQTLFTLAAEDVNPQLNATFTREGALIITTSYEAPATRLLRVDPATAHTSAITEDPHDLTYVWRDPATGEPVLTAHAPGRLTYTVVDPAYAPHLERMRAQNDGDVQPLSASHDGRLTLYSSTAPDGPIRYYLYDRDTGRSRYLFSHQDELARHQLAPSEPFTYTARDGLEIHGYLTCPPHQPHAHLPAVVLVHGGPWMRDTWGYNSWVQWLANRGYAVIQVNFRGSVGYGKAHLNAGDRQWGRAMSDDLVDAVDYLAHLGVIDRGRVGIMGRSYGGFAALCGAVFTPEVFRCAVSQCGPTDLVTEIKAITAQSPSATKLWHARVGDPEIDADRLREFSPLTHAARLRVPVLIAQGANDPRVPRTEAEQMVKELEIHGVPHRYLLFENEGHHLTRPENQERFFAETEEFLADLIGGACQDISTA